MTAPIDPPDVLQRFESTLDLVEKLARRVTKMLGEESLLEDLIGFGRAGLLEAARRFDPSRGVPFRTYAHFRVHGAIIDGVRTTAAMSRRTYERLHVCLSANQYSEGIAEDVFAGLKPQSGSADADVCR